MKRVSQTPYPNRTAQKPKYIIFKFLTGERWEEGVVKMYLLKAKRA
jgi:hypothetical protein